jgi:HD superfamily phosphohydrolase
MPTKRSLHGEGTLPLGSAAPAQPRSAEIIEGASTKAQRQEIFLPVTGFAWFYPEEIAVIDHPAFQRLGRINQLGQAYFAFRGATHKRFEHVLGVVHIVQKMISSVNFNVEKSMARNRSGLCAALSEREQRFIRLGALLHDIGHVAAGHTLEDELELIGKHDADERLDLIFENSEWDSAPGVETAPLKDLINREYAKYVPRGLASDGLSATDYLSERFPIATINTPISKHV